jgi:hypothetical protein
MKYTIGPEMTRQIVLKYRYRLKALLAEHEVRSEEQSHLILLGDLCRIVEEANKHWKDER